MSEVVSSVDNVSSSTRKREVTRARARERKSQERGEASEGGATTKATRGAGQVQAYRGDCDKDRAGELDGAHE